jgi:Family of unknown function (DUF5681)
MSTEATVDKQRPAHLFKPGQSGNPAGRPRGSRNKLTDAFVQDVAAAWEQFGVEALERVARDEPATLLKVVASLMPKSLDVSVTGTIDVGDFAARFRNAVELLHNEPQPMRTIEHADVRLRR